MFDFLNTKHNDVIVFDHTEPEINETTFRDEDWSATPYGNCKVELTANAPKLREPGFSMRAFVDSDYASDCITRRSRTGFLIHLNCSPSLWYSKKTRFMSNLAIFFRIYCHEIVL